MSRSIIENVIAEFRNKGVWKSGESNRTSHSPAIRLTYLSSQKATWDRSVLTAPDQPQTLFELFEQCGHSLAMEDLDCP